MRGRKPTPTALKLVAGNPGKRPLNRHEPKPVTAIPTCPAHLMPTAKTEWKRLARYLHDLGVISELDRAAPLPPIARPMAAASKPRRS
jgi:phage terminase small subunit